MGIELRRIRSAAGLSLSGAARHLSRSPASLSKIENGYTQLYDRDLDLILDRYEITDETYRQRLHHLNINGRKKGWWTDYNQVAKREQLDFIELEAEAIRRWDYVGHLIAGLLQTEEYATAVLEQGPVVDPEEGIGPFLRLRMDRQRVLTRADPPRFEVVLGEAALRQLMGGRAVMRDQLELLIDLSESGLVHLQVLPFSAGAHAGIDGSFRVLEVEPDLKAAFVDHRFGTTYTDEEEEVARCLADFTRLQQAALSVEDSRAYIRQVMAEL